MPPIERPLDEYDEDVNNEDIPDKHKYDENEHDEDRYDRERLEANYDKDDFDKYVYGQDSYDEEKGDRDEQDEETFEAPVRPPSPLDLFKIRDDLSKMRRRASSSLSICLLVSVWFILLCAVLRPVSAAATHMNHQRMWSSHHVRLQPLPISSLTTFGLGKLDSTPSIIAAPYAQHTGSPSPRFIEYAETTKADRNLPNSTSTESLQPLHARAKSLQKRDNSGLSTGALAGVVIGAIAVAALTFGICVWKCVPKMEQVMG